MYHIRATRLTRRSLRKEKLQTGILNTSCTQLHLFTIIYMYVIYFAHAHMFIHICMYVHV